MENNYDALVVLGKNWRRYPKKDDKEIHLSIDSKLSSLAAGELLSRGEVERVIFSGGNTAGNKWPTEAGAMKDYMLKHYDVDSAKVNLEEESLTTVENAKEIRNLLEEESKPIMMTVSYHSPRAKKIFSDYGVECNILSSESVLEKYGDRRLNNFVESYSKSCRRLFEEAKENLIRGFQYFDKKGKITDYVAGRVRKKE